MNKILSKLFDWLWKTQGDYEQEDDKPAQYGGTFSEGLWGGDLYPATEQERIPIIHTICSGQWGWYLGGIVISGELRDPIRMLRMDGTHPLYGSLFRETCPECGGIICCPSELKLQAHNPII